GELFPTANPKKNPIYQDVMDGIASPGIEFYMPLFFDAIVMQTESTLAAYLPKTGIVMTDCGLEGSLKKFWSVVVRRTEDRRHNVDQPILPPEMLFTQTNLVLEQLNQFGRIIASQDVFDEKAGVINLDTQTPPRLPVDPKREKPFIEVKKYIDAANHPVLLVAESAGRRETLKDALRPSLGDIPTVEGFDDFVASLHAIAITSAPLERGLVITNRISVVSENQLYEHRVVQ